MLDNTDTPLATESDLTERSLVNWVDRLLHRAIGTGASDIHIEPFEASGRIRLRYDGLLHETENPPAALMGRISARLKVMAQLNIAEKRLPQDGRLRAGLPGGKNVDFRLSILPTLWGEKLVLRVLDPGAGKLSLDNLGFDAQQLRQFTTALEQSQGLILVTGPTGSGKTITLYSGLDLINRPQRNIASAEDPIEMQLDGVNQVAVNMRLGLDFASILRAFLRQDPDVLMVGEIRDGETAEIAVKAGQTGHLVLSTLHTKSASESLNRLINMGVPGFNLATGLSLIIAQRLLRRLCDRCKQRARYPSAALVEAGFPPGQIPELKLYRAVSCHHCHDGYRGRIGIYEVIPITEPLAKLIMRGSDTLEFAAAAKAAGFKNLRHAALRKVAQGQTSLEEANRLTSGSPDCIEIP